jgi:predicted SprT family Zn-dependent metalloprotease
MISVDVKSNLYFDGACVGARISYAPSSSVSPLVYDISNDDLILIGEDFPVNISKSNVRGNIILVAEGNQLVPSNGEGNARELTYGKFAGMLGHDRLSEADTELKKMYNHYNRTIFGGKLPSLVPVYWSNKMTSCAGKCYCKRERRSGQYTDFRIGLSTHFHQKFPDEIVDTLVHEMLHVYLPGEKHNHNFKSMMMHINRTHGMNLTVYSHESAVVNYIYACQNCDHEYTRLKKLDLNRGYRCGKRGCRGSLVLKQDNTDEGDPFDDTDWGAGRDW